MTLTEEQIREIAKKHFPHFTVDEVYNVNTCAAASTEALELAEKDARDHNWELFSAGFYANDGQGLATDSFANWCKNHPQKG